MEEQGVMLECLLLLPTSLASPVSIWNPSPSQSSEASTLVSATLISHLTLQQPLGWPPASTLVTPEQLKGSHTSTSHGTPLLPNAQGYL